MLLGELGEAAKGAASHRRSEAFRQQARGARDNVPHGE